MPADPAVKVQIGGDASGLISALEQSKQAVSNFGSAASNILQRKLGLKDVFKGVLQGVGIASVNQIADKLVAPFKDAAESAQKIEQYTSRAADATERLIKARQTDNQQLGTAIKQMERFQAEATRAANAPASKSFFGGIIQRGSGLDKLFGFSAREDAQKQEAIAENTALAAEKAVEVEEKKAQIKQKNDAAEMKAAKEALEAVEKQQDALKKLSEFDRETKIEKAQGEQKINLLQEDRLKVMAEIAKYEAFVREGGELFKDGLDDLLKLKTKQRDLEKEIAELTAKKATSEQLIALEIRKQNDLRNAMASQATENTLFIGNKAYGSSRSPEEIKRASDQELQEFIKRQRAEIQSIEAGKGRGPGALADAATNFLLQGTVIARLQTDVMRALAEINMRSGVRKDISMFGEGGARARFAGDPLQFDTFMRQFVEDSRSAQKVNTDMSLALDNITKQLKTGIPVVYQGGDT